MMSGLDATTWADVRHLLLLYLGFCVFMWVVVLRHRVPLEPGDAPPPTEPYSHVTIPAVYEEVLFRGPILLAVLVGAPFAVVFTLALWSSIAFIFLHRYPLPVGSRGVVLFLTTFGHKLVLTTILVLVVLTAPTTPLGKLLLAIGVHAASNILNEAVFRLHDRWRWRRLRHTPATPTPHSRPHVYLSGRMKRP